MAPRGCCYGALTLHIGTSTRAGTLLLPLRVFVLLFLSLSLFLWSTAMAVVWLVGMSSGQAPSALPQGHVLVAVVPRQLMPHGVTGRRPRRRHRRRRRRPCSPRRAPCCPACNACPWCLWAPRRPWSLSPSQCTSLPKLRLELSMLVLVLQLVQCVLLGPLQLCWLLLLLLLLQPWYCSCCATHATSGRVAACCWCCIATGISFRQLLALLLPLPALQQGQVAGFLGIPCLRVWTRGPRNWDAATAPRPHGMCRCIHTLQLLLLLVLWLLRKLSPLPTAVLLRLLFLMVALPMQLL